MSFRPLAATSVLRCLGFHGIRPVEDRELWRDLKLEFGYSG